MPDPRARACRSLPSRAGTRFPDVEVVARALSPTSGSCACAGTRDAPRHRERDYPAHTAGVKTARAVPPEDGSPGPVAPSDYRPQHGRCGNSGSVRGSRGPRHAGIALSGPRGVAPGCPRDGSSGSTRGDEHHRRPPRTHVVTARSGANGRFPAIRAVTRRGGEEPRGLLPSSWSHSLSSYSRRSRTPRAGWPGRSRCRTSRSRGRRRPRATRTSPTWPPRWARPGCCGSAGDPCRPG